MDLPADKSVIGCKWVYRETYHSNGTVDRYKARLVAKGFTQVKGADFNETFSPVAKMTTIHTILAIVASQIGKFIKWMSTMHFSKEIYKKTFICKF